jgi:hypothetical protein
MTYLVAGWRGAEELPPDHEPGEFMRFYRGVLPGTDDDILDRLCPACGADLVGNDPHSPGCPLTESW